MHAARACRSRILVRGRRWCAGDVCARVLSHPRGVLALLSCPVLQADRHARVHQPGTQARPGHGHGGALARLCCAEIPGSPSSRRRPVQRMCAWARVLHRVRRLPTRARAVLCCAVLSRTCGMCLMPPTSTTAPRSVRAAPRRAGGADARGRDSAAGADLTPDRPPLPLPRTRARAAARARPSDVFEFVLVFVVVHLLSPERAACLPQEIRCGGAHAAGTSDAARRCAPRLAPPAAAPARAACHDPRPAKLQPSTHQNCAAPRSRLWRTRFAALTRRPTATSSARRWRPRCAPPTRPGGAARALQLAGRAQPRAARAGRAGCPTRACAVARAPRSTTRALSERLFAQLDYDGSGGISFKVRA